jgi:hypothetical protein
MVVEEREALKTRYQEQQRRVTLMQTEINKVKPIIEKVAAENKDLNEKVKRAARMLRKAKEAHRKASNIPLEVRYPGTLLEMDVELRLLRSTVEEAVGGLVRVCEETGQIEPRIRQGLAQIGLGKKSLIPMVGSPRSPRGPTIVSPHGSARSNSSKNSANFSATSYGSRRGPFVRNIEFPD